MADPIQAPSLELIVYKLDQLFAKFDDHAQDTQATKARLSKLEDERVRKLEDEILKIKTIALPLGMAFSAAVSVLIKMFIDSFSR
jgi:hypothetical protein